MKPGSIVAFCIALNPINKVRRVEHRFPSSCMQGFEIIPEKYLTQKSGPHSKSSHSIAGLCVILVCVKNIPFSNLHQISFNLHTNNVFITSHTCSCAFLERNLIVVTKIFKCCKFTWHH